jgi:MFS family permease
VFNYRLYFIGQGISLTGTWLQTIAQTWLMLELTNSATMIGLLTATQFLPVLLLGPIGGVIADRFPKRRIIYITQSSALLLALILALLVSTHNVHVWMVFVLAACLGLVNVVDSPTRQTFIMEMVGRDNLKNAVTLNSIEVNLARVIGPAVAAVLIAKVGLAQCFFFNALSYIAVLVCLAAMKAHELEATKTIVKIRGQLGEGFRYVKNTPILRNVLIMMAIIGTLSYEFPVVLPVLAKHTFHGGATSYALLTGAMGVGSVIGGLITASRQKASPWLLSLAALGFGISMLLVAISPTVGVAALFMVAVGIASIGFLSIGNSTLQLDSDPAMRGRVMSLWSVAFLGSTPIGGPIIGLVSEHASPRWGLVVGGVAALVAAVYGISTVRTRRRLALVSPDETV